MHAAADVIQFDGLGKDRIHGVHLIGLAIDGHRIRLHHHGRKRHILGTERQRLYGNHRDFPVILVREAELDAPRHHRFQDGTVAENLAEIIHQLLGYHREQVSAVGTEVGRIEENRMGFGTRPVTVPQKCETVHPAAGRHFTGIGRQFLVPFDIAARRHGDGNHLGIIQRKVMDQPDTESQQEREQQTRKVPSPCPIAAGHPNNPGRGSSYPRAGECHHPPSAGRISP